MDRRYMRSMQKKVSGEPLSWRLEWCKSHHCLIFQFLYGIYHLNYLKSVIFRRKSGIQEPRYHVVVWLLEKATFGLPQVCKIF